MASATKVRGAVSARPSDDFRSRAWRVSLALLWCFIVLVAALHTLLDEFGWFAPLVGVVIAVLGAAALGRALSARRWVPTVAAVFTLWAILSQFFVGETLWLRLVPVRETWQRLGELAAEGTRSIEVQAVPATVDAGILFLLCLGIGGLAVVADLLAVTLRAPAVAGLPLVALLAVPSTVGPDRTDAFLFVLACIAFLALLRAGRPARESGLAVVVGATTVVATLIVPLVLPPVSDEPAASDRVGGLLSGVNPVLDLGQSLRREAQRIIINYTSRSGDGQYLRLVSLQNFTGELWEPDEVEIDRDNRPQLVGDPPGMAGDVATETDTVWVRVQNLGSPWLPVPYPATSIAGLIGNWFWDAETLTFTSPNSTSRGQDYRVSSLVVQPTPAQLVGAGPAPAEFDRFLELPEGMPEIIAETAASVTASATSDYARAFALQEFFRNGSFSYSETAPVDNGYDGTGMEMIAAFLEAKAGYCVHFASAMAVMARTLGIPSRVAVGTLPGAITDQLDEGRRVMQVSTSDLHAWPELYFDGVGWVRFEPTTSRGFVPEYADRESPGVPSLPPIETPEPTTAPTPTAAPVPTAGPDEEVATDSSDAPLLTARIGVVALAFGLLLLPALIRALVRKRRLSRLSFGAPLAATGWRELLDTAHDLGLEPGDTTTPREAAAELGDSIELARTVAALEREAFAPPAVVSGAIRFSDVNAVLRQLRGRAGWRARVRASLVPRSLFARVRNWRSAR
ncbi:MAG: hypothetical protein KF680_07440 [Cryobacterium sp.]|nr:hypothetical protein [Cryobacterium sp.]